MSGIKLLGRRIHRRQAEKAMHIAKYVIGITGAVALQKWLNHLAYMERGYNAIGGEALAFPVSLYAFIKGLEYIFNRLLYRYYGPERK